jgi:FAD/FMN-containing dehydrogenase
MELTADAYDLTGVRMWASGTTRELMRAGMRVLASRVCTTSVVEDLGAVDAALAGYACYVVARPDPDATAARATLVVRHGATYPPRVAVALGRAALAEATPAALLRVLKAHQDAAKVDALTRVQGQTKELLEVARRTIDTVLERGERIEDLVARSEELSKSAEFFYRRAKKARGWCGGACAVQ